ncbi:hypothetical protein GYMLUDRAFT_48427 [Collybiopsis luxurians FD-317 M1]|uniref:Uncharacterized protein n=1 Tax=Collybiopsis luxurians FD-317 M1 TaxID=944289 RepID=A0A0D0BIV7_9AGAR|nr:hypothetical protein GYMLUDRAFT_48427 [Collybiopsis luxurians FD-317 M1]
MAGIVTVNLEVGDIIKQLRESIEAVYSVRKKRKEQRKAERNAVYCALSLHPALDSLHLPTLHYSLSELAHIYSPPDRSWPVKWLQAPDKHLSTLGLRGTMGRNARVMLILLWVIGHRLSDDDIDGLISQACEEGLRTNSIADRVSAAEVNDWVDKITRFERVFVSLRKTIKRKQPMKQGCNPFDNGSFSTADEHATIPIPPAHSDWLNALSNQEKHEYNIRDDPSCLLQVHQPVIIPQSKLTRIIVKWSVDHYGLGKRVGGAADKNGSEFRWYATYHDQN